MAVDSMLFRANILELIGTPKLVTIEANCVVDRVYGLRLERKLPMAHKMSDYDILA